MKTAREVEDWTSNADELSTRPRMTWRCEACGAEFGHFTYGGPCPGRTPETGCGGELKRRKVALEPRKV